jgi:hypothetical protein
MSEGRSIVTRLKEHVLEQMREEPKCAFDGAGLGNIEIETMCDLALGLDSQDHYLTYSLLHSLIKDGVVEQIRWPESQRHPKYRLRTAR